MKNLQKFILPVLVIGIILILYFTYFAPRNELGSFSDFDTNSNANREIIVKLVKEKGFIQNQGSGSTIFYVLDKAGKEVKVEAPSILPPGLDVAVTVTLRGHLHTDYFHATEVSIPN